jgi:hypothetical protein
MQRTTNTFQAAEKPAWAEGRKWSKLRQGVEEDKGDYALRISE